MENKIQFSSVNEHKDAPFKDEIWVLKCVLSR